ncbi:hypothetical protein BSL78_03890 [Apostichopus japonicus]|uniref:Uncharacterized protein n=1 Tax=Stichopus japonicus TaxID=307972 RepID=A0A2G8LG15_STIJA|nr:hypothetical protein BSL78_03890 [Apostichopus japonicus]
MRRLSNINQDPNEHLPALYDNADGGIPKDKNIEQNRISRTVQLLPWGSTSYYTRALEENIAHKIRQRRHLRLENRKRSAHNRPDEITSSASASNHKSTICGTSTKYGVPYRNEARMLPLVTDTTSRLSLSSSGSTSSLLSLSIISQEDYTAPSVDDVMAFDSLYSETEANEDPFEDDSYHLELLFPSSDDSLYSTIQENDIPRNNGAYAIDLPLEFDNFCTVSPPSSDSSSSLVSPSDSSSLLTQEDYVDPFADDIFASDRSNTQSQADESSLFDFEASWDSETDEDEVSHYGNPYHLELPFANSFGSAEFTQVCDIPFGFENISTISSLSSSSSDITSSLAYSSSNSSISSEDDVIDDVNNDDILMALAGLPTSQLSTPLLSILPAND